MTNSINSNNLFLDMKKCDTLSVLIEMVLTICVC